MKNLAIITGEDNKILRTKSVEVKRFDTSLKKLVKAMKSTMAEANGLGLAAPQVGENIRLCIITLNYNTTSEMVIPIVNPEIINKSEDIDLDEEGCLSLPGVYAKVWRNKAVTLRFDDLEGNTHVLELEGLNSREVQHEIDHLDGVLFIDRVED